MDQKDLIDELHYQSSLYQTKISKLKDDKLYLKKTNNHLCQDIRKLNNWDSQTFKTTQLSAVKLRQSNNSGADKSPSLRTQTAQTTLSKTIHADNETLNSHKLLCTSIDDDKIRPKTGGVIPVRTKALRNFLRPR